MKKHLLIVVLLSCVAAGVQAKDIVASRRAVETGLRPAVSVAGEPEVRWTIEQRLAQWKVPAVSIAVIRDGKLAWAQAYGVRRKGGMDKVDVDSVFSVGSLSKVAGATVTLRLVDQGVLQLDRPVNAYLKRWTVPDSPFGKGDSVTLRGLLSHSAGLSVSGFTNYQPGEALPTLEQVLDGVAPAKNEPVRIIYTPGTKFQYSGGGTTVEELAVEEVTGRKFWDVAHDMVFAPLGMSRSTYVNPLPAEHGNVALAHNNSGEPSGLPRGWETMPEHIAAGLWTSARDYAKLVVALMQSYHGADKALLSQSLARDMMTEVGPSQFGLGPVMSGSGFLRRFSHSGGNASYRAYMEGNLATGSGVVILTNARSSLNLIHEVHRAVAAAEGYASPFFYAAPKIQLAAANIDDFTGQYRLREPSTLLQLRTRDGRDVYNFARAGGDLMVDLKADDTDTPRIDGKGKLIPIAANQFVFSEVTSAAKSLQFFEFVRGTDGVVSRLIVRFGDNFIELEKVKS